MRIRFLGHACVAVDDILLFDPFLTGNPLAAARPEEVAARYILVSHAHPDHLGDTVSIARRQKATVISTNEVAVLCQDQGAQTHGLHLGGRHAFDFGAVRCVTAFHGSGVAGGHACGFLVDYAGKRLYFAGDTGLYSDMQLLRDPWGPVDIAFLPIGGNYTMDAEDAALAARWIAPAVVIPIHYDTWPLIAADPSRLRARVERDGPSRVVILQPGETYTL